MIRIPRLDYCTNCNTPRSIECYDINDKPLNYAHLLDYMDSGKEINLKDRLVKYMKCTKCGHVYCIDWQFNTDIPRPLHLFNHLEIFIDKNYSRGILNRK